MPSLLAQVLEEGDYAEREEVVRWVRSFPFSFLTDRCEQR